MSSVRRDQPEGPRRVVTGFDQSGKSSIVNDRDVTARIERPGGATVTEIWRVDRVPADVDDVRPLASGSVLPPPPDGLAIRVCTFPPDSEVDPEAFRTYSASIAQSYGQEAAHDAEPAIPGMHRTDTVDVVTVVSGELCLVTERGETVLRPGDSVVQRGTPHLWSNRSDTTAIVMAVMISAERPE
jgi:hypothetical protein